MSLIYTMEELCEIKILSPLSKKHEVYLNDKENDIICFGGAASSGKTFLSALDILVNAYSDPHYRSTIVRRQKEQFKTAGGLYDECCQMYEPYGIKPRGQTMDFKFPTGAMMKMMGSDKTRDTQNFQGSQCTTFLVDEAQQLNERNIVYLLSRLRSKSKQIHQLKLTCNPEYGSFLRVWLERAGYLDLDTGLPIKEMDGVTTYYCEVAGETVFKKTLKEFEEEYAGLDIAPLKFVFYSANVNDNPFILKNMKSYVSKLKNLPKLERARLYEGAWRNDEQSGYFKREWVEIIPHGAVEPMRQARAYDKASTKPSAAYPDPDWTVGVKGGMSEDGYLVITDVIRFRDRSAVVQKTIEETGLEDGKGVLIGIPQDVGGAGKDAADTCRALLMKKGLNVTVVKANKSKAVRFEPVAIIAGDLKIRVVKGDWNEAFFAELETLDFNTRKRDFHDDQADALSDLLFILTKKMILPQISMSGRSMTRSMRR